MVKKFTNGLDDGPVVANPYKCVVGCTTCATLCQGNAISFPDKKALRELYKKERIWAKVKKELKKEGCLEVEEESTGIKSRCLKHELPPQECRDSMADVVVEEL